MSEVRCDGCGQYVEEQETTKIRVGQGTGHSESMVYCNARCQDLGADAEAERLIGTFRRPPGDMHEPPPYPRASLDFGPD